MIPDWLMQLWQDLADTEIERRDVRILKFDESKKEIGLYAPNTRLDTEKICAELKEKRGIELWATNALQLPSASSDITHGKAFPVDIVYQSIEINQELSLDSLPRFTRDEYLDLCNSFSLIRDGDERERTFASLELDRSFPAYERLWKVCIVPLTHRIDFAPFRAANTNLRTLVNNELLIMAQMHYSVMSSLLHAFRHLYLHSHLDCHLFDVFAHLGNASEQAQLFLLKWIAEVEERIPWEHLIKETHRLRDWESRGKVISDYASDFLSEEQLSNFLIAVGSIAVPRNALIHGPEITQLVLENQKILIGKDHYLKASDMEHQLQWWANVLRMRTKRVRGDLHDASGKTSECYSMMIDSLNSIWDTLASRFTDRLFASEKLQQQYHLQAV